jgi:5'-nucleotidase/UDP-sugar diphosphatase
VARKFTDGKSYVTACLVASLALALGCINTTAHAPLAHTESGGAPPSKPCCPSGMFTILHTNDIHGDLSEFAVDTGDATSQTGDRGRTYQEYPRAGIIGGFARLATAVDRARTAHGAKNTILIDAGDTFGDGLLANLTRGEATIRMMNALGYSFMAFGNHDFEYTAERTRQLQTIATFPMRGANVIDNETHAPFLGDPTLIVTLDGIRVGFLALGYHNTDQTGNKENTRGLSFWNGADVARRYLPALRLRADVIVVLSHQGTTPDSVLAADVPGIDVIVGGHSHDFISPPRRIANSSENGTWIVQALSDASALGELTIIVAHGRATVVQGTVHELYSGDYPPEARFAAMLDSIRAPFRDTLQAVIATAAERLGRHYKSESPVDVLAAEILRRETNADVAFLPGLGFGVTIQPGPITREMVFGLFPHPTTVVHERLTGRQIVGVLEQSATNLRPVNEFDRVGGLIQTSGLRWRIDLTKPVGHRISDVYVGDHPISRDENARYCGVTNGGLLQGTHRQTIFAHGTDIVIDKRSFAITLEDALRKLGTIHAPTLGAVTLVK